MLSLLFIFQDSLPSSSSIPRLAAEIIGRSRKRFAEPTSESSNKKSKGSAPILSELDFPDANDHPSPRSQLEDEANS